MIELRFQAVRQSGQSIMGSLSSETYAEGKKKIQTLVGKHNLTLKD